MKKNFPVKFLVAIDCCVFTYLNIEYHLRYTCIDYGAIKVCGDKQKVNGIRIVSSEISFII